MLPVKAIIILVAAIILAVICFFAFSGARNRCTGSDQAVMAKASEILRHYQDSKTGERSIKALKGAHICRINTSDDGNSFDGAPAKLHICDSSNTPKFTMWLYKNCNTEWTTYRGSSGFKIL
jgi:hypothetical protein